MTPPDPAPPRNGTASGTLDLVLLLILTAVLGGVFVILWTSPDVVLGLLEPLELVESDVLRENRGQFYVDLVVFWTVGASLLGLDWRCRRERGRSLWTVAFGEVGARRATSGLRGAALVSTVFLVPALVVIYTGSRVVGLEWLIAEDGILEYANAVGFGVSAVLLGSAAWRRIRAGASNLDGAILGALAAGAAFVAFEEISWGQRIFGVETPASLEGLNTQNELNLHNIATDAFEPTYLVLGAGVYAIAWIATLVRGVGGTLPSRLEGHRLILPDPSLVFLAAVPILFAIHITLNELIEGVATVTLLLYAIDVRRRAGEAKPPDAVNPASDRASTGA